MYFHFILFASLFAFIHLVKAGDPRHVGASSSSKGHGETVMGYPAQGSTSPQSPRSPQIPPDPEPNKPMKDKVWDHFHTEAKRSSDAVRQQITAVTVGTHAVIGVAKPLGKYICQTALCADPASKQRTENIISTRFNAGTKAVSATWRKARSDLAYSKENRQTHLHNYKEVKKNGESAVTPEFRQHYTHGKNIFEQQQVEKEQSDFYQHSKHLKQFVRHAEQYPPNTPIEYPNHNN